LAACSSWGLYLKTWFHLFKPGDASKGSNLVVEGSMEAQMSFEGKNLLVVCFKQQSDNLGHYEEEAYCWSRVVPFMQSRGIIHSPPFPLMTFFQSGMEGTSSIPSVF